MVNDFERLKMPYKDYNKKLQHSREFYKTYKSIQLLDQAEDRKINPWKHTLSRIKQRCNNPNQPCFKYYGGRGIKCLISLDELKQVWFRDKAYEMKHPSIDRINNDGNYEFNNCRFIELSENSIERNSRCSAKPIVQRTINGEYIRDWKSVGEAAIFYKCHISAISNNLLLKSKSSCGFIWSYK
jgi:hypothetical protein